MCRMKGWAVLTGVFLMFVLAGSVFALRIVPPPEYGRVIISKHSRSSGFAPVVFDHWLHRSKFTCRLCHVDIGFAMKANETGIGAAENEKGLYCGTCHDGKRVYSDRKIFPACTAKYADSDLPRCERCHSKGKKVKREYEFEAYTKKFPQRGVGNGIDWEKAEEQGLIKPVDFLDGVSMKRTPLKAQKDFSIESRGTWMSDIIFSHAKHARWNGCEVCHPEIFPAGKRGTVKYTMFEIAAGEYCGLCHLNVAFPIVECDRCHTKPVTKGGK